MGCVEIVKYQFLIFTIYLSLMKVDVTLPGIDKGIFRGLELSIWADTESIT